MVLASYSILKRCYVKREKGGLLPNLTGTVTNNTIKQFDVLFLKLVLNKTRK